jgi:ABC-type branched-subunit amino acid transport system permease subunit
LGHAAFMGVGAYGAVILYARYDIPLLPSASTELN